MLILRKGASDTAMPREVWFALGIAHALHGMYILPDLVVTDFSKPDPELTEHKQPSCIVKLRMRDMREFDRNHFVCVLARNLEPMGFMVYSDLQHAIIEFRPENSGRVHAIETHVEPSKEGTGCRSVLNPQTDR